MLTISVDRKPKIIKITEDCDIFAVFSCIASQNDTCFIMEPLIHIEPQNRFAIIGFSPPHVVASRDHTLYVDGRAHDVENPFFELRRMLPEPVVSPNYAGGLVGYVSYEAVNYFEPTVEVKTHELFDQFRFGVYTDGLLYDTMTGELSYFYYTKDRSKQVKEWIAKAEPHTETEVAYLGDTLTPEQHQAIVAEVKEEIKSGNIFQCEVGFKTLFRIRGDALAIYKKLRAISPSPYMYYVKFNDQIVVGASPELLFSLHDGNMSTRPLAGTVRRGNNERHDRQLARQLLTDPKEIAEHNMLVDLHRNDIGRVAELGSVRVQGLKYIRQFSHVQHIESEITGLLRQGEDMFSAFAANFPAGTLSGAPKIEAMKIINRNEPEARGPYGGGVGYFGFNGNCQFSIAIRSLFINGDTAYGQTSSGIVYDSHPAKEYAEIQHKFAGLKETLGV